MNKRKNGKVVEMTLIINDKIVLRQPLLYMIIFFKN